MGHGFGNGGKIAKDKGVGKVAGEGVREGEGMFGIAGGVRGSLHEESTAMFCISLLDNFTGHGVAGWV